MGNKRNRKSRRLETPSPDRRLSETQVETPDPGNMTSTISNVIVQESLDCSNSENQLTEPSRISNKIQVWIQMMEEKNNDRITKMRKEIYNKFEMILKEIKNTKSESTATNPRSETNETQGTQQSGRDPKSSCL